MAISSCTFTISVLFRHVRGRIMNLDRVKQGGARKATSYIGGKLLMSSERCDMMSVNSFVSPRIDLQRLTIGMS